jgi:Dehydrogenases with different specificities (related to short-chain alcohol dehydrogenases)
MNEKIFNGQVVVITGAGQGIGYEIARQLCRQGANTILNDIDDELAKEAAEKIGREGGCCIPVTGDAGDNSFVYRMVEDTVRRFGTLDIAIANAGITIFGDFFSYSAEALQKVMTVNLGGSFFLAQASAKQMKMQQNGGSILLMSSVTGHQAHKNLAAYGMTKAGIELLAKTLVVELSPYNISINAIAPGATVTERTTGDQEFVKTWSQITPIGHPASVADIANAALFLVSPSSRHITGQTLVIDGGWTSVSPQP